MAKKSAISKAEHVRQMIGHLGMDTRPKDIIAKLAEKNIKVSPAQVSNIKAVMKKSGSSGSGRGRRSAAGSLSIDDLVAAKKLADQLGGVAAAQRALDALARLR
ncbi:MAG: hypothetical protein K1X71_10030 [Pirellulales bacterium]|nr:hypothetical protein [Pirellulales bacterium]